MIGRVFWLGALARLTSANELDEILRTLRRRELIVERLSSRWRARWSISSSTP